MAEDKMCEWKMVPIDPIYPKPHIELIGSINDIV
jgi:hypothetical protein